MNGKLALRKFLHHLGTAPDGAPFEVGDMYAPQNGWRVYLRVGDVGLAMGADSARELARLFKDQAAQPEWSAAGNELRGIFEELEACAAAVDRKNRDKVMPPDIPNVVWNGGRA